MSSSNMEVLPHFALSDPSMYVNGAATHSAAGAGMICLTDESRGRNCPHDDGS